MRHLMRGLFALSMMLSTTAWAKWVEFGGNDRATFYFDSTTVKKTGHVRSVLMLEDEKKAPARNGAWSHRLLQEFDCKNGMYRTLSIVAFSGRMATAKTLSVEQRSDSRWNGIPPRAYIQKGSPADTIDTLRKLVCK
jgi:hypothetical protein